MKKIGVLALAALLILTLPAIAFGLTGPTVTEGHGEVRGLIVSNHGGLQIGGTYGINNDLGVLLEVGDNDYTKLGVMYQLNPNLALEGGMMSSEAFVGVIGATALNKQLQGLGEINLFSINDRFILIYQVGVEYAAKQNLDIRGGIIGTNVEGAGFQFEMGVGYQF